MITLATLANVTEEINRLVNRMNDLKITLDNDLDRLGSLAGDLSHKNLAQWNPGLTSPIRRASLDLSSALIELRRSEKGSKKDAQ